MKEFTIYAKKSDHAISIGQYLERFEGKSYFYGNAAHAFYDVMVWLQKDPPKKKPNIVMPVHIPPKSCDRVQQALCDAGVVCYIGWPEAPFGKKGFKQAVKLKKGLLELPVHKYINSTQLKNMVDCLNSLSP